MIWKCRWRTDCHCQAPFDQRGFHFCSPRFSLCIYSPTRDGGLPMTKDGFHPPGAPSQLIEIILERQPDGRLSESHAIEVPFSSRSFVRNRVSGGSHGETLVRTLLVRNSLRP